MKPTNILNRIRDTRDYINNDPWRYLTSDCHEGSDFDSIENQIVNRPGIIGLLFVQDKKPFQRPD